MGPKPLAASAEQSRLGVAPVVPGTARSGPASSDGHPSRRAAGQTSGSGGSSLPAPRHSGDTPAARPSFEDVYEAGFDFVWRSLILLGVDANAAEDATQEVFSVVSRQLGGFEGRSSVRTWLFAIVQRVAANQRRTRRRKQHPLEPLDEGAVCSLPTPLARVEAAESIDIVQRFCNTLDPEHRAVFVLALLEELPGPEVSQALGIPVNTVYSRVRHLRDGLRRLLDDQEHRDG